MAHTVETNAHDNHSEEGQEGEGTTQQIHDEKIDPEKQLTSNYEGEKDDSSLESGESSGDDDDLTEVQRYWPPPTEESVELVGSFQSKTLSAFAFNNAGTRFAAGGYDHDVKIWDFEALDRDRPASICNTQPCGQTIVKNLDYSNNDDLILVISGGCQAVILGKDGLNKKEFQCPKGDQYIADMANTKGHVQMLNDGCWNPKDRQTFITCSNDSTIRIWDLSTLNKQQKTVIKTRSQTTGMRATPNVCRYSRDSLTIAAGCNDGSVMMWDTRRKFLTTSACIKDAHLKGSEITGLDFSYSPGKLCTRSEDESCKIWDLRQLKSPLASKVGLETLYSTTDCSFSPDDKLVITGSSKTEQESGRLYFLNSQDLSESSSIEVPGASVIRCKWHPKINHIGYTCSDGSLFIKFDKRKSIAGFLVSNSGAARGTKRKKYVSQFGQGEPTQLKRIITPHSLPLFRDDQRRDLRRAPKPELPKAGEGPLVRPAGSTLSSYIARNIAKPIADGGMSIRDKILRHAEEAEREPLWFKPVKQATSSPVTTKTTTTGEQQQSSSLSKASGTDTRKGRQPSSMQQPQQGK